MAAQPDTVSLLRTEILHWFQGPGVGDETLAAAIALATSEAVGNVVRHAYGTDGGRVELDAERRDDDILVRVADSGLGLSARARHPDRPRPAGDRSRLQRRHRRLRCSRDHREHALRPAKPGPTTATGRFSSSRRPLIGIG